MTARILVVDDIPANLRLLEAKLEAEYYQVAAAESGQEALQRARQWQPDLVLLDVMMPGMDGYQCCAALKADPATQHIPVVMVTALGDPQERLHGLQVGADDFLTKPVEYEILLARTRSLVRLKRLLDEWRARAETARALGLATSQPPPSIAGARALVVDDWDYGASTIEAALAQDGVVTVRARGRAETEALTAAVGFDLIVLSLSLAQEDALALAAGLRASEATQDIPLLLVGAPALRPRVLRGFELGANDWVTRPLDENELRARARNQIRRKLYQDRLRADLGRALEQALTDPLTGLYNRRYLTRHLHGLLGGGAAPGAGQAGELALLMIDIDHFKAINDRHGHAVGDRTLQAVSAAMQARSRAFDTLARVGGEEFVLVMPGAGPAEAQAAAERLRDDIERLRIEGRAGVPCAVTVSIGIAATAGRAIAGHVLLDEADCRMYLAKRTGRNRVVHGDPPDARRPLAAVPTPILRTDAGPILQEGRAMRAAPAGAT
jgi:two-component system cell cycle response regulator